jgi:glycosyltransferase involved in cell wall biosynthesis
LSTNLPLVSIVVPAYNHAHYLAEAIDSILSQDYPNMELIVLDDGSIDNTREVLESYGNRFYWESHQNMGQSNTLNKGWGMAKGEILAYISADDVLLPQAARMSVECLLENPDAVLCYCDFQLIDPESRVIRNVITPEYSYKEMVTKFICAPGPGAFFRRKAFNAVGGWNPALHSVPDYEYWFRLGLQGDFVRIPKILAAFRIHSGSQSFAGVSVEQAEEPVSVINEYFSLSKLPAEILSVRAKAQANAFLIAAQLHLRSGRYIDASKILKKCIASYPRILVSWHFARVLFNGLINQLAHKVIWIFRSKWFSNKL